MNKIKLKYNICTSLTYSIAHVRVLYVMCARREGLVGQEFNYFKQQPLSPNQTANKSLGNQRFRRTAEPVPHIPILVTKYQHGSNAANTNLSMNMYTEYSRLAQVRFEIGTLIRTVTKPTH